MRAASFGRPRLVRPAATRLAIWLAVYLALLFSEISFFPVLLGFAPPAFSTAALVLGVSLLGYLPGFLFALFAGLARDILLAPAAVSSNTAFAFFVFFAVWLFRVAVRWDESILRIGAVSAGFASLSLARFLAAEAAHIFFSAVRPVSNLSSFFSRVVLAEAIFAGTIIAAFSAVSIIRFRRRRAAELTHI